MQSTLFEVSFLGWKIAPTWYGAMYALSFILCYFSMKKRGEMNEKELDTFLVYTFFGVIVWWRIGYVLLYDWDYFIANPLQILAIWKGGMSFHGGLIGVISMIFLFTKKTWYNFFSVSDTLASVIPIGLFLGRIGNFINKELLWYPYYTGPFAIWKENIPYFPSPLLEWTLEWIILFILLQILWKYNIQNTHPWIISSMFLIGYAIMRIISEFFRMPDRHIGYLWKTEWITLGMVYSSIMLWVGSILLIILIFNTRKIPFVTQISPKPLPSAKTLE